MDIGENTPKTILRPRKDGETIKVTESVLKRRDRNLQAAAHRARQIAQARKTQKQAKKGKINLVKPETLVQAARVKKKDMKRLKKVAEKRPRQLQKTRCIVVVRNGRPKACRGSKKVLNDLGLSKRNSLVVVPNNPETATQLDSIRPFAYWGKCSFKVLFNLIHKRAEFRESPTSEERVPLADNTLIEKHLGDLGVLCTEDLVHTLFQCDKNFDAVTKRLWSIPVRDDKKATSMVKEDRWLYGHQEGMNERVAKLIGE